MNQYMYQFFNIFFLVFGFWLCNVACGIFFHRPETEPMSSAEKVWSPNHWTGRELSSLFLLQPFFFFLLHLLKILYIVV